MKKKIVVLFLFMCLFITGCTKVQDESLESIINQGTSKTVNVYNKYRKGYKYNLVRGLSVKKTTELNEIIKDNKYTYFLYVDAVSYYNKIIEEYQTNEEAYVSMPINYEDKYGYLEINELVKDNYLIEIMYNYAKIEVIVNKKDINVAVSNAICILSSVTFNDNILSKILDSSAELDTNEIDVNIFEVKGHDSEYLQAVSEDIYKESEGVHDKDIIK